MGILLLTFFNDHKILPQTPNLPSHAINGNDFNGTWQSVTNNDVNSFTLTIKENGQRIKGYHCYIGQSGKWIDCSDSAGTYSLDGVINANEAMVNFVSFYSETKGKAKILLVNGELHWKIVSEPSGDYYLPKVAVLRKLDRP